MKTFNVPEAQLKSILDSPPRNNLYYYTEEHGLVAKSLLDKLHSDSYPIRIQKGEFHTHSIRLQWYQGIKYLLDKLDKDNHYAKLYARTICRTYKDYIELHKKAIAKTLEGVQIVPWREALEEFFDTAKPNDKFNPPSIDLTKEEITWIENQLATMTKTNGDPLFYGQVEKNKILLIRDEN